MRKIKLFFKGFFTALGLMLIFAFFVGIVIFSSKFLAIYFGISLGTSFIGVLVILIAIVAGLEALS